MLEHQIRLIIVSFLFCGVRMFAPAAHSVHQRAAALFAKKSTLSTDTTWQLSIFLRDISTVKGNKVDDLFTIEAQFIEEEGYEPPQGVLKQISAEGEPTQRFKISKSRWQLSEDPNERKDGLWVWGLFKEPLYPFLLLKLEIDHIPLPGSDGDSINPLKLFAQMNHRRDNEKGVLLDGAVLKFRQIETVRADPFGAANVDVYEEVSVGTLSIKPML